MFNIMILRLIILRKSKKTVLLGGNVRKNPCIYGMSVLVLPGGLILDDFFQYYNRWQPDTADFFFAALLQLKYFLILWNLFPIPSFEINCRPLFFGRYSSHSMRDTFRTGVATLSNGRTLSFGSAAPVDEQVGTIIIIIGASSVSRFSSFAVRAPTYRRYHPNCRRSLHLRSKFCSVIFL